ILRTWTVSDCAGNTSTGVQTITIYDDTAPVLTLPADTSFECSLGDAGMATAEDNCDGTLVPTYSDDMSGLDNCGYGDILRTWTVSDCAGNTSAGVQTITIYDNTPPVIAPLEDGYICNGDVPEYLDTTWSDNCEDGAPLRAYANMVGSDECSATYEYVFNVSDCAGNAAEPVIVEYVKEWDKIGNCETAFARADVGAQCFIPDFKRWGWTNYFECEGTYEMPLYAGAAQCDVSKGAHVGNVTVEYIDGMVTVTYGDLAPGYVMTEAHVYIGCEPYPQKNGSDTVAPGQYPFNPSGIGTVQNYSVKVTDISGPIYVIAHAVTCEIVCMCSPEESDLLSENEGGMVSFEGGFDCPGGSCEPEELVQQTNTVDFKAYPVPFESEVTLQYTFEYDTDVKVEVFDIKGALIRSSEDSNYTKDSIGTMKLDLSGTDNQMFFVRLTTKEGTLIKKIVSSTPQ
ncbi:HYR-like domain-containing protein, partial [Tamlana flava]|uniref:HYR-like domain-containing protein n=1 Tax=Tamlana flava TaxID=3158572 RepID=UPI00351AD947